MSAATRRRRSPPKKKSINPLLIAGPLVGLLVILVIVVLVSGDGDGEGDTPTKPDKTPEQIAAEKERLDKARQKKLDDENLLRQAKLQMEYNKRAAACKTADDFAKLAREAARDDLKSVAEGFYLRALTLDPESRSAHRGLGHKLFDCSRNLENWDMISFGGISDKLTEFSALEGTWVPPLEYDRVVAKWKEALPRFTTLVETIENDPYEQKVQSYSKRLKNMPFYEDLARTNSYTISREARPVVLFIQEALDRDENHADQIERRYAPPLIALEKHMKEKIFDRLGFECRDGFNALIVWVLNSHGSYDNFHRIKSQNFGLSDSQWAHYNFQNKEAITFLETRKGKEMEERIVHFLLHEMVHYYQDAYAPYGIRGISSFWVVEGMAEWVSTFPTGTNLVDGPFLFESKNTGRIREFLGMIDKLDGMWPIPMIALLDIDTSIILGSAIEAAIADEPKIAAMGSKADIRSRLTSWTYGFGYCMCRYLSKEYEDEFYQYLDLDLNGDAGAGEFKRIFGIKDLNKLERDLVEYYK